MVPPVQSLRFLRRRSNESDEHLQPSAFFFMILFRKEQRPNCETLCLLVCWRVKGILQERSIISWVYAAIFFFCIFRSISLIRRIVLVEREARQAWTPVQDLWYREWGRIWRKWGWINIFATDLPFLWELNPTCPNIFPKTSIIVKSCGVVSWEFVLFFPRTEWKKPVVLKALPVVIHEHWICVNITCQVPTDSSAGLVCSFFLVQLRVISEKRISWTYVSCWTLQFLFKDVGFSFTKIATWVRWGQSQRCLGKFLRNHRAMVKGKGAWPQDVEKWKCADGNTPFSDSNNIYKYYSNKILQMLKQKIYSHNYPCTYHPSLDVEPSPNITENHRICTPNSLAKALYQGHHRRKLERVLCRGISQFQWSRVTVAVFWLLAPESILQLGTS